MEDKTRPCLGDSPADAAATFVAHLADGPDDAAGRVEHLRCCPPCAAVAGELRTMSALGPDMELRLLRSFREWRDV